MKKYIILSMLFTLFGLVSCYDDDSSLGTKDVGDITIGPLEDASIISYSGNKLIREPEIETTYPDDQLTYAWYIYKEDQDKGFRTNKIDSVKNLSYEVNLPAGSYTIIFEATATTTGYAVTAEMKLAVSTTFSQGFYILKETEDGNTELDVYTQNGLVSDLFATTQGEVLPGSPRNLSVGYSQAFIDTEENKMVNANTVCITTEQNKVVCLRTVDMLKAFDNSNLLFEEMDADEEPYCMVRSLASIFYFSNKGIRFSSASSENSGKMGFPLDNGGSKHVQIVDGGFGGHVYWNNTKHRVMTVDYNCVAASEIEYNTEINQDNLECLSSGLNYVGGAETIYFLCQDKVSGTRYLYLLSGGAILEIRPLNSALHLAQGDIIAGNGLTGTFIYSVHNNKLYAYNFDAETEIEIPVTGLPTGETISYVFNLYWNMGPFGDTSLNFDHIVIGTQKENTYTVYLYNIRGGQPYGTPIDQFSGEGKLKSVRYVCQLVVDVTAMMGPLYGYGPCFPY